MTAEHGEKTEMPPPQPLPGNQGATVAPETVQVEKRFVRTDDGAELRLSDWYGAYTVALAVGDQEVVAEGKIEDGVFTATNLTLTIRFGEDHAEVLSTEAPGVDLRGIYQLIRR